MDSRNEEMTVPKLTILEQLKSQRVRTQKTLQEIDEAIKALEDNPSFEKMLNMLSKVTKNLMSRENFKLYCSM